MFTEFHSDNFWLNYVNRMSLDGTWADNVIIQSVADSLNLQIRIVESNELFASLTHIEPVVSQHEPSPVFFLGHIDEIHYVYSLPLENPEETIGLNSRLSGKQKDPFNCTPTPFPQQEYW